LPVWVLGGGLLLWLRTADCGYALGSLELDAPEVVILLSHLNGEVSQAFQIVPRVTFGVLAELN
jgi:hypothetical protein